MLSAAAGFLLLAVVFLFAAPWVSAAAGAVGLLLLLLVALGLGRRTGGRLELQ